MPGVADYLERAMAVPGATGACVLDYQTGTCLGVAGEVPEDGPATAGGAAAVLAAATRLSPLTSAEPVDGLEDVLVTSGGGIHLLRALPGAFADTLALYLRLDRERGNLAVARLRLAAIGGELVAGP